VFNYETLINFQPQLMQKHLSLAPTLFGRAKALKLLINSGEISLGGNAKLKIYGTLKCSSGKRMKVENRVFFRDENEAIASGFRPCGHCMREKYLETRKQIKLINNLIT
jgi:hypothetical protein